MDEPTSDKDPTRSKQWEKHYTFRWTDPVVEEILSPGWDGEISPGEAKELAQDFLTLKRKFKNMMLLLDIEEDLHYELLDKINNFSDEELLRWRKERQEKNEAVAKTLREIWDNERI